MDIPAATVPRTHGGRATGTTRLTDDEINAMFGSCALFLDPMNGGEGPDAAPAYEWDDLSCVVAATGILSSGILDISLAAEGRDPVRCAELRQRIETADQKVRGWPSDEARLWDDVVAEMLKHVASCEAGRFDEYADVDLYEMPALVELGERIRARMDDFCAQLGDSC